MSQIHILLQVWKPGGFVSVCGTNPHLAESTILDLTLGVRSEFARSRFHSISFYFRVRGYPLSWLIKFINFMNVIRLGRLIPLTVGVHFFDPGLSQEPDRSIDRKRGESLVSCVYGGSKVYSIPPHFERIIEKRGGINPKIYPLRIII